MILNEEMNAKIADALSMGESGDGNIYLYAAEYIRRLRQDIEQLEVVRKRLERDVIVWATACQIATADVNEYKSKYHDEIGDDLIDYEYSNDFHYKRLAEERLAAEETKA